MRCSMHRERIKNRPSVPETLASLYDILIHSSIMQNIYIENIITTDGKTAIILSTDYLLQALSSTTEIYVDGTFSVLPRKPHIAQLYSVHIRYMDTGIATLFVLCDTRTTTLYNALWNKITQLIPQLEQNIKFVMSDFELAAVKSLNKKFPRANLTGCWFHFNQAVLRKWAKLRLSNIPKMVLSMTMTLPLLPPDMFQEALLIIQTEADLLSTEYPDILQFISYLRLTWSNMASKISTYRCPVRTNNIVESFHNIAMQKLGTRNINVWTFLDKLSHLITDQELDLRRLNNGVRPRRLRTRANREFDSKIINAQKDLVNQRLSLKEFLLMFTTNNNIFQMEQLASLEDATLTNDEHIADMELFSDNLNEIFQTTHEQPQTNITSNSDNNFTEIPNDESIYEVPEDEYLYLIDNNASSEDLPFHIVNWNLEDNQTTSEEKSSIDVCTVCLVNERTHVFIPCGHLACCSPCIERFEANRCPICNVIYENYVRVRKP
ncbi:uncharacterized protein [Polyergus mexicanus]|uniref:uncharacterized protein n=1 Tax=Polyergus mexicanus TaxID=615972 RepID=UPI0038B654EF